MIFWGFEFDSLLNFHICSLADLFRSVSCSLCQRPGHEVCLSDKIIKKLPIRLAFRFGVGALDLWCSNDRRPFSSRLRRCLYERINDRVSVWGLLFPSFFTAGALLGFSFHRRNEYFAQVATRFSLPNRQFVRFFSFEVGVTRLRLKARFIRLWLWSSNIKFQMFIVCDQENNVMDPVRDSCFLYYSHRATKNSLLEIWCY